MLVLLGPRYEGSEKEVEVLARETGLTGYDLRARLRPGSWGVIRVTAEDEQAAQLVDRLVRRGLPACSISSSVGQDQARRIVYVRGLRCDAQGITLRLAERSMTVPYGAMLVIVRGEVHVGRSPNVTGTGSSFGSLRPSAGGSGTQELFLESHAQAERDVFAAADLHFATVPWVARIDARELDFPPDYVDITNLAERMDRCLDDLARVAGIRIDRGLKTSSLASHTVGPPKAKTPLPGNSATVRRSQGPSDEHFDAYSRMVAEAERAIVEHR